MSSKFEGIKELRRRNYNVVVNTLKVRRTTLMQELDLAQKVLWDLFAPTQVNVAAIGNKTPQLHVHVIARFASDPAWPQTVWDHPIKKPYDAKEKEKVTSKLREAFCKKTS